MAGLEVDSWMMMPWFAPNMTQAQLEDLVAPLFAKFASLGLSVTPTYAEFDNFYDAWDTAFPLEFWGINVGRVRSMRPLLQNCLSSALMIFSYCLPLSVVLCSKSLTQTVAASGKIFPIRKLGQRHDHDCIV